MNNDRSSGVLGGVCAVVGMIICVLVGLAMLVNDVTCIRSLG